ncbi:MAG: DUF2279 domain-containing protein [Bacteroidota bacterium]|nr:DUF2279 domain-containing protein [Bacteroidota bacterium]
MKFNLIKHLTLTCLILLFISFSGMSQKTQDTLNRKRLNGVIIGGTALYATSMTALYHMWYKNYPQTNFHFFNDNDEWLLLDKCGHVTTSYAISTESYKILRWTGLNEKKSILYGGITGFVFQTVIETLDGFSEEWGASPGDIVANSLGSGIFITQQLVWHNQRVKVKWSTHLTSFAKYRPDLLGNNAQERLLKDYNGQTFWLSANIKSFFPTSRLPKWFNIAIGYGGTGMTGATQNTLEHNNNPIPYFNREPSFYLAPDIDFSKVKTNSKFLKFLFEGFGFLKTPSPTLEIKKNGSIVFHLIFF